MTGLDVVTGHQAKITRGGRVTQQKNTPSKHVLHENQQDTHKSTQERLEIISFNKKQVFMRKISRIMASVLLVAAFAAATVSCSKEENDDDKRPPHAASTEVWRSGGRTWSDAIHMPDCNKEDFDGGTADEPKSDGRSYTYGGKTYYYYSGLYVIQHVATMCPAPWRLPTEEDFDNLNLSAEVLGAKWGLSGYADRGDIHSHGRISYYWLIDGSFYFGYEGSEIEPAWSYGFQVRCVK
jgi:hypothetical protein